MTTKKTKKATPPKKATAAKAKKSSVPPPKTVVVDKPSKPVIGTPRHRKTGEKYEAPKLVSSKKLSREEQAAANNFRIRGQ